MNKYLFILFIFTMSASSVQAELKAPEKNSCEFYLSLEETVACGPSGYAKDFGYPYCEQFLKSKYYRFSNQGKKFLKKNAFCLQTSVYNHYTENKGLTCKEIKATAFAGHADCFIKSGFCELSLSDKVIFTRIIKDELPLKVVRDQIEEVLNKCKL